MEKLLNRLFGKKPAKVIDPEQQALIDAYLAEKEERTNPSPNLVELGNLVNVQLCRGGLLRSDECMVETDKGIYRVEGTVFEVKKGARVWKASGRLHIANGEFANSYALY
jgi:hypothetical protein